MMPAPAPAINLSKGVIRPSPPLSWDWRAIYLHEKAKWYLLGSLEIECVTLNLATSAGIPTADKAAGKHGWSWWLTTLIRRYSSTDIQRRDEELPAKRFAILKKQDIISASIICFILMLMAKKQNWIGQDLVNWLSNQVLTMFIFDISGSSFSILIVQS